MNRKAVLIKGWLAMATVLFLVLVGTAQDEGCRDSDNGSFYAKGITRWGGQAEFDRCLDTGGATPHVRLLEWYCDGRIARQYRYTCPNGCGDGVCVGVKPLPDSGMPASVYGLVLFQFSSDGGSNDVLQQTGLDANGDVSDSAQASCDTPGGAPVAASQVTASAVTITTIQPGVSACIDSDGGRTYSDKGRTNGANGRFVDKCRTPTGLEEWYCDGYLARKVRHKCKTGCVAGECR